MPLIVDGELVGDKADEPFPYPNVPLGILIDQNLEKNLAECGDGPAITDVLTGQTITFSQLLAKIRAVASGLKKRGLQLGDAGVAIGNNYIEFVVFCLGVWRAGGVLGTLIPTLRTEDYVSRLKEMKAKFVLAAPECVANVLEAVGQVDIVKEIFSINKTEGCLHVDELIQDSGDECPENIDVPLDLMGWMGFTSGTTGKPKAINYSHRNLGGFLDDNRSPIKLAGRKLFFVNPFNNGGGVVAVFSGIMDHVSLYIMPTYSEENILSAIDGIKPQAISIFPSHIAYICRHPLLADYDLSSIVSITALGSLVNPKYEREIFEKLPNLIFLRIVYGMTEIGMATSNTPSMNEMVSMNKEKAVARHVIGSAGKVHRYVKIKILDETTGDKLGPNEVGEVFVKNPFSCTNYFNNPEATADFFREGGWVHTGDKAYYDEQGNLFIVGRFKELIKYRNIHVVPSDIEKHMITHPAVADVGVVGLPDDVDGERPFAFVKLRSGVDATAEELIAYTNERVTLDAEKLRGGIRFVNGIPRNALGKIVRPELTSWL